MYSFARKVASYSSCPLCDANNIKNSKPAIFGTTQQNNSCHYTDRKVRCNFIVSRCLCVPSQEANIVRADASALVLMQFAKQIDVYVISPFLKNKFSNQSLMRVTGIRRRRKVPYKLLLLLAHHTLRASPRVWFNWYKIYFWSITHLIENILFTHTAYAAVDKITTSIR